MKKPMIITAVSVIIVGAAAFFGGMKYQQSKFPANGAMFGRGGNTRGTFRNGQPGSQGGRAVMGEVVSQDDKSITVKLTDGGSKIVIMNDKTSVVKSENAAKTDIMAGTRVAVFGTENTDGSVTAQNIQLNPQFRNAGNGGNTDNPGPGNANGNPPQGTGNKPAGSSGQQ